MSGTASEIVHVRLAERSYDIHIGSGTLAQIGASLAALRHATHVLLITDDNVQRYATEVAESVSGQGAEVDILTVAAGETSKSVETTAALWTEMLGTGADRKTVAVAVGGGVVGDLAGFVAATYARGIALVQVPTSLLAQVDSSVGGKTGINLSSAKNMVGAFWQPLAVFIDTHVLRSLPEREYAAGLAEVIKYGVIQDADFFTYLQQHVAEISSRDDGVLRHIIARCCRLKADVVEADERETSGRRAILNYGHTFAHALEAASGYGQLLHGEAVSIGMLCASRLAESLGRTDAATTQRQQQLLQAVGLPVSFPLTQADVDELLKIMGHDKKAEHGRLRFVLPDRLGHVELVDDVDPELVRAAWMAPS